ncbi:MAG TPA: hypothetical protein VL523_14285 [Terriglobia bacterium]|nr:hypothetical protein [Terriglobia bacterium]
MKIMVVMGAWVAGSFLFGLLAGRVLRSFAGRGPAEEDFIEALERKTYSVARPVNADSRQDAVVKVA